MTGTVSAATLAARGEPDPRESADRLLRDLRTSRRGLAGREAARRLAATGENVLVRSGRRLWVRELLRQLTHPLAALLWLAALLALASGTVPLAVAIVVVVLLNAVFAFAQERHAVRAVEALEAYLPQQVRVRRDDELVTLEARLLVPGDVVAVGEGERANALGVWRDGDPVAEAPLRAAAELEKIFASLDLPINLSQLNVPRASAEPILAASMTNFNADPKREFIRERELLGEVLASSWQ